MRRRRHDITDVKQLAAALRELANRFVKPQNRSDDGDGAGTVQPLGPLYKDVHAFLEFQKSPEYAEAFLGRFLRLLELQKAAREHPATSNRGRAAFATYLLERYHLRRHLRWLASMFEGGRMRMNGKGRTETKPKKRRRRAKRTVWTEREREAVELHSRRFTLAQIGKEMRITKQRAQQLLDSARKRASPSGRSVDLRKATSLHANTSADEKPAQRTTRQRKGN